MEEQKLGVALEGFVSPASNLTIVINKNPDGMQKNKRLEVDTQSEASTNSGDFSDRNSASTSLQESAEGHELKRSPTDGALSTSSVGLGSRVSRLGSESIALLRRFGQMHPESEQERIATMELQKEKVACRIQEADNIIKRSVVSSSSEEMEAVRSSQDVRAFCKALGFAGVDVPRRKLNGRKYALHSAVKRCDARMVGLLLRAGADPNALDSRKQTPLQLAEQLHRLGKFDMTAVISQFLQVDSLDWESIHDHIAA